jgi:hypothetical protein
VNTAQKSRLVELVQRHYSVEAGTAVGAGSPANNSLASKLPHDFNRERTLSVSKQTAQPRQHAAVFRRHRISL